MKQKRVRKSVGFLTKGSKKERIRGQIKIKCYLCRDYQNIYI